MATKALATRRRTVIIRKVGRRAKKTTVSLAILAGFAPTAAFAYNGYRIGGDQGGFAEAAHRITLRMTGWEWKSGQWSFGDLVQGVGPLVAGAAVHKLANRFGINRMIASAGIPILRI
jgi:hypothetical protein